MEKKERKTKKRKVILILSFIIFFLMALFVEEIWKLQHDKEITISRNQDNLVMDNSFKEALDYYQIDYNKDEASSEYYKELEKELYYMSGIRFNYAYPACSIDDEVILNDLIQGDFNEGHLLLEENLQQCNITKDTNIWYQTEKEFSQAQYIINELNERNFEEALNNVEMIRSPFLYITLVLNMPGSYISDQTINNIDYMPNFTSDNKRSLELEEIYKDDNLNSYYYNFIYKIDNKQYRVKVVFNKNDGNYIDSINKI